VPQVHLYPPYSKDTSSAIISGTFTGSTFPSNQVFQGQPTVITISLDTALKSPVTCSLASTGDIVVSPAQVTLQSGASIGKQVTVTPRSTGQIPLFLHFDGKSGPIHFDNTLYFINSVARQASWVRYCPPHEISVRTALGETFPTIIPAAQCSGNLTMNLQSVLPTFWNVTLPIPPINKITFQPSSVGVTFSPSSCTITPPQKYCCFSVTANAAGVHLVTTSIVETTGSDTLYTNAPADIFFEATQTISSPWSFQASSANTNVAFITLAIFAILLLL